MVRPDGWRNLWNGLHAFEVLGLSFIVRGRYG